MVILFKILFIIVYISMIATNFLANSLPFFGRTTGEVSAKYPTLFTPSGFTFSIWGIIYLLLGVLVINLVLMSNQDFSQLSNVFIIAVLISFILNGLWLVFWHSDHQLLATIVIVGYLVSLIFASLYAPKDMLIYRVAIDVNLAWISVATIANISILLYASNINLLFSDRVYFITILIVGVLLVTLALTTQGTIVFGLVFIWAYFGILMRYISEENSLLYTVSGITLLCLIGLTLITYISNNFSLYK